MRPSSYEIYVNACKVIPGGVNSPVRAFQRVGIPPLIARCGKKDRIIDQDGNSYIDYCMSWGALILGHAPHEIVEAAISQVHRGSTFGLATEIEERLAAKVVSFIPSIEKIRFVSSGTEATMSAIRLARGYTGRSKIVKFSGCYHGHSDALLAQAGSGVAYLNPQATSKGVTAHAIADTITLPFNDLERLMALFSDPLVANSIAAVILEPIPANMGVVLPDLAFLRALQGETKRLGALLIFDEVITGFRVGLQGAQGLYGVMPDLTCFGKIIGGGFPAAAFGGRTEIMDQLAPLGEVYQAGTLSGNPVAMSAGLATLCQLEQPGFYEHLEQQTNILTAPIRECIKRTGIKALLNQAGSMFTLFLGVSEVKRREDLDGMCSESFARLFRALFKQGIYLPPLQQEAAFVSSAHTKESLLYTAERIVYALESASSLG
jgi:glutamate-1-semialdehyde 2,1-aminomutase